MKKLFAALLAFLMVFTVMPAAFPPQRRNTHRERTAADGQRRRDAVRFCRLETYKRVAEPSKPYNFIGFNSENPSAVQSN